MAVNRPLSAAVDSHAHVLGNQKMKKMNINYRQVLVIVSVLILFELMSVGLKKCTSNSDTSIFPSSLNDSTSKYLIGKWKTESQGDGDNYNFITWISVYRANNKHSIYMYNFNSDANNPLWSSNTDYLIQNGELFNIYIDGSKSGAKLIVFASEDEMNEYRPDLKLWVKYSRLYETKHPFLHDNSK